MSAALRAAQLSALTLRQGSQLTANFTASPKLPCPPLWGGWHAPRNLVVNPKRFKRVTGEAVRLNAKRPAAQLSVLTLRQGSQLTANFTASPKPNLPSPLGCGSPAETSQPKAEKQRPRRQPRFDPMWSPGICDNLAVSVRGA